MIFHGTVFLIVGLLAGFHYGQAIVRKSDQRKIDAWRAAHTGLISTGILTIVVGAALNSWSASGTLATVIAYSLIVSGYSFCVAMPLAAYSGTRGLSAGGPLSNKVVFAGYAVSILGTFIGALGFLRLAWLHY